MRWFAFLLLLSLSLLALIISTSAADDEKLLFTSPEEIIDRITTTVYGLKGYKAEVRLSAVVHSLGGIGLSVRGELYVRTPDRIQLKLLDVPEALARRYQTSFSSTLVPGIASKAYKKRYHISLVGIRAYKGKRCFLLLLKPKKESNVVRVLMWVSADDYTIPKVIIFYRDGGRIVMEQEYESLSGRYSTYKLIRAQRAEMFFPKVRATLTSEFYDYVLFEEGDDGEDGK